MNGANRATDISDVAWENVPAANIEDMLNDILANVKIIFSNGNYQTALRALVENESLFYEEYFKTNDARLISDYENAKGFILLKQNDITNSKTCFETSLKYNPESSDACLGLGEIFIHENNYDAAKIMLEWAVKNNPANQTARQRLENLSLSKTQIQTETKNESEFENGFNRAYQLFTQKDFNESIQLIEKLENSLLSNSEVEHSAEDITSLMNLKGFNYLGLNDVKNAQTVFEISVNLNPNSSQANVGMGEVFYIKELDNLARDFYEKALKLNSENQMALSGLQKLENPEENEIFLEQNLSSNSILNEVYTSYENGDYRRTLSKIDELENVMEQNDAESLSAVLNIKAFSYLGLNNLDEAKKYFEKALQTNPQSSQACAGLGELYLRAHMYTEAKVMYEWALRFNEHNQLALNGMEIIKRTSL